MPVNLTVSVTNRCNSRCKTCHIWTIHNSHPELEERELALWEYQKTFRSIGKSVTWATISGGEPYLRTDLDEICESLVRHCSPYIINIPTNALLPEIVDQTTRKILERCDDSRFIVNLSLDGVGAKHDEIRGVPGNFQRFLKTYQRLKRLRTRYPNLHLGIHTVVSRYNMGDLFDVYRFAKQLDVDSYITEIAENRFELLNIDKDIAPDHDAYARFVAELSRRISEDAVGSSSLISRTTEAFRLVYYQIASQQVREQRQVIPCYAGLASCQLTPYGEVWPCCVLGSTKSMGKLREVDYGFDRLWLSGRADEVRRFIRDGNCACPLANAHYTNILCSFRASVKVLATHIHMR